MARRQVLPPAEAGGNFARREPKDPRAAHTWIPLTPPIVPTTTRRNERMTPAGSAGGEPGGAATPSAPAVAVMAAAFTAAFRAPTKAGRSSPSIQPDNRFKMAVCIAAPTPPAMVNGERAGWQFPHHRSTCVAPYAGLPGK